VKKELGVSVSKNVVTVEIICADAYEAQVVHDDIIERMRSGEGLSLGFEAPKQAGVTEIVKR
jgi:hypothetical protein